MIVEARVVGQRSEIADREVPVSVSDATTLRAVLREVVSLELDEYVERQNNRSLLRILTPADLAIGSQSGRYRTEPRPIQPGPTLEQALARALEGFTDGLYFVFLNDRQIEDLDAPMRVDEETRLRFVRLVALAGG